MRTLVTLLVFCTHALAANGLKYEFRITEAIVTPATQEKCAPPFEFHMTEEDFGLVSVNITIEMPEPKRGVPDRASLIVGTQPLPVDPARDFVWVHDATHEKNQKSARKIDLPSGKKRTVHRLFTLPAADARSAAIHIHYQQPTYGGDDYWVLIGRYMKTANPES
ncbi:MAG TPA: hypothetical protein VGD81_00110 [Opitutaceae bacterium]